QAQDWGEDNVWFDETTTEGNYWSDLKKIPYLIDGPAKSFDPYPINFIIDKTYLLINPLLTLLPFIITLTYFLKVKYRRDKLKCQNPLQ
ncbi:MAG: hypothetical protein ACXABJ_09480, partial [Candidatus Heimdallarchaeaceae archaeon]